MKMRCKLIEELKNEYFSHLSETAFALMAEYDGGFDILKKLAFNDDSNIHIYKCKTMLEFTSLVATIGKYCNNENGEGYIIYKADEYIEGKEIHRGTMNSTSNSIQNHVYELLYASDMLVIVKSESYSDMGDAIRNSVTVQPRIDIMYMCTEEEKIVIDDVYKTLSKKDIDKLNEALKLRKTAEAIHGTTDAYELPKASATTKEDLSDAVDTCSTSEVALKHNTGASTKSKKDLQPFNFYVLRDYLLRKADDIEHNECFDRAELEISTNTMCYQILHELDKLDSVLGLKFDFIDDMYNSYADPKETQLDIAELYNIDDNDIVFIGLLGLTNTSPDIDVSIFPEVHMYIDKENEIVNIYVVDKNRKKNVPLKARIARDIMDLVLKIDATVDTDNSIYKNIDNIAEQIENKMNAIGFTEYTTAHIRISDQYKIGLRNYINYIDPDNHSFAAYSKPDHKKNVMNIYIVY